MTVEARFIHGTPRMVDYTPGTAKTGGSVIVVGDIPLVAHRDIAANEKGALASGGGVYEMTAGEAIAAGKIVYWKAADGKVTETAGDGSIFGYLEPDSSSSNDGDLVRVIHMPNKTSI